MHHRLCGCLKTGLTLVLLSLALVGLGGAPPLRAADSPLETLLKTFHAEFVSITPGRGKFPASFSMGTDQGPFHELPAHRVTFAYSFSIAKYEAPQNLYEAVMGINPSKWKGPRNSVELFSYDDAVEFCKRTTRAMRDAKLIGDNEEIRLPTEAEWEYCCRAGTTTPYSFGESATLPQDSGNKASLLDEYGWHTGNAAGNDPPVGAKKPNGWGLYDMHGYLWEFTSDAWHDTYAKAPLDGSSWTSDDAAARRVVRGGSWKDRYESLRSAYRRPIERSEKDDAVGLRCVKAVVKAGDLPAAAPDARKAPQPAGAAQAKFDPIEDYSVQKIEGWKVLVNRRLEAEPELCAKTLELLGHQLYQVSRMAPAEAAEKLKRIPLWVELAEPHHPCMCYHPDAGWLSEHDMNPKKARGVEVANAQNFLTWTKQQPWMVFHELAHGYHHQFVENGFDNGEIIAAFDESRSLKRYETVMHIDGRSQRAYALTNPMEYFAEQSEAFFGTNDFFPFVASELKQYDPRMHALLEKLWGRRGDFRE
jgi:formylglycine-generating enzyme required for sulfatase activity